ncbi:acyltransferase family protein [Actinopolymorpha pittospori]|uniref:Surface polysaccharide O-acyltransferase-like enzyme n=1 Tax=Actinopolymorpha pittospori TaxID=648752 RepID=A0A927RIE0_9ACTN|nr:acyltransferase [Actinopolymorpha pittospori]MBE1604443.1 surface polysaccharide O-acyltransferase-like enzyme [Actinopolymorpha pittospori]
MPSAGGDVTTERAEPTPVVVASTRRPELDAIRTLVVIGLVFFHASLVFDTRDDFYVKNAQTTELTTIISGLCVVWAMPILFLIAGLGAWHSLRRRGSGGFAVERLLRLGVPLVVATLTIIPVPQWLRLRTDPDYHESYLSFLPRFFDVHLDLTDFPFVLAGEHFETGHLWFVVLLLTYALLLALAARWLPSAPIGRVRERIATSVRRRGMVLLPAVPVALISAFAGLEEPMAGWSRWAYLLFFLYGFTLACDERFRSAFRRDAGLAAVIGLVLLLIGMPAFLIAGEMQDVDPFTALTPLAIGARTFYGATGWCFLVAITGLLDRRRTRTAVVPERPEGEAPRVSRVRRIYVYLVAAALPFYVLHQPILVGVAYEVVRWDAPSLLKYVVIVAASMALTIAAYDLLVRRVRVVRLLLGVRG